MKKIIALGLLIFLYLTVLTPKRNLPLRMMGTMELAQYDGTNPNKPIYLAMNGLVYDVTKGKQFYVTGGPYHDLAGKDSSKDLNLFGGKIIERKYPVIARFIQ